VPGYAGVPAKNMDGRVRQLALGFRTRVLKGPSMAENDFIRSSAD
jgi:hypothetical protein